MVLTLWVGMTHQLWLEGGRERHQQPVGQQGVLRIAVPALRPSHIAAEPSHRQLESVESAGLSPTL